MNDRELTELAAKAAGINLEWDGHPDQWQPMYYEGKTYHSFEPLTDDGDAFRLAVKCDIAFGRSANTWWARWEFNDKVFRENAEKDGVQDPYAAARRAIVRVAAEIGKTI